MNIQKLVRNLGVDVGTSKVCIYDVDQGVFLREPSLVSVRQENGKEVFSFGDEAAQSGYAPGKVAVIHPMLSGAIADSDSASMLLRHLMKKIMGRSMLTWPRVVLCIPGNSTEMERRTMYEMARAAGANKVYMVQETLASAVGANLPVADMAGSMIVNIGGGITEAAILAYNGIVTARSVRIGGQRMDEAIAGYVKNEHGITIDNALAEEIRFALGNALPPEEEDFVHVDGWDADTGMKKIFPISATEVYLAIKETVSVIVSTVRATLAQAPPEFAYDIMAQGICLAGGCAMLRGLPELIAQQTTIPVFIADYPRECAAIGAGRLSDNAEFLRKAVQYGSNEE